MRHYSLFLLTTWCACQPIVIGAPAQHEDSELAGDGGKSSDPSVATGGDVAGGGEVNVAIDGCEKASDLALSGRLTTPLGQPLVRTKVQLVSDAGQRSETLTDQGGSYRFGGLCAGRHQLSAPCINTEVSVELEDNNSERNLFGKPVACDDAPLEPQVLLLVYDPVLTNDAGAATSASATLRAAEPTSLAEQLSDFLLGATNGHVRPKLVAVESRVAFPPRSDGSSYDAEQYTRCLTAPDQCLPEVAADVALISARESLCEKIWQGAIDEVWLLGGPHFGFAPLKSLECTFAETGFVKHVDLIGLDFGRGLPGLVAGYQARSHEALLQAFDTPAAGGQGLYAAFSRVASETSASGAGCGKPGWAPNSTEPGRFDDPQIVSSNCDFFLRHPDIDALGVMPVPMSCQDWGCSELGFARFWFSHLPRARWLDEAGRLADFWRYVGRPDERNGIVSGEPICSSSYKPGWCALLGDGEHAKCNDGEWATKLRSTGAVEIFYDPPRIVTSVTLYDRRCSEQVLAGHIEFSDGSPALSFGALDNGDISNNWLGEPKTLPFPPKMLSGLRVVIDASQGDNPGLAELTVASAEP